MKNLSEKFDHLPQDFDREAIWKGIEKPGRQPLFRIYFRVAAFVAASAALIFVFAGGDNFGVKSEHTNKSVKTGLPAEKSMTISGTHGPDIHAEPQPDRDSCLNLHKIKAMSEERLANRFPTSLPAAKNRFIKITDAAEKVVANRETIAGENRLTEMVDTEGMNPEIRDRRPSSEIYVNESTGGKAEALPFLLFSVKTSEEKTVSIRQQTIPVQQKSGRQSLAFRAGAGIHYADFSSPDDAQSRRRNDLEKTQLDYSLGMRYEYLLRQNFLFSVSATYQLFKDKITTGHLRESMGRDLQVDYKLHNHYHVFSAQAEAGKRFYGQGFFWDVSGGVGLKFFQASEVDYFTGTGELADEELINDAYQSAAGVFFTARAAIGKHLGSRLFVRTGTQISSGIDLTAPKAGFGHRIVPVSAFIEAGLRF